MSAPVLTSAERKAIASLRRLAKTWPRSLGLFSWSGNLEVIRLDGNGSWPMSRDGRMDQSQIVETIAGILNDGGDPS